MSDQIDIGAQTLETSPALTDRLFVQTSDGLHPVTLSDLAKAVRETVKVGGRNLITKNIYNNSLLQGIGATKAKRLTETQTRILLSTGNLKKAGYYSVYCMAKADIPITLKIDVNDKDINSEGFSLDDSWREINGTVYVDTYIGSQGFMDISIPSEGIGKVYISDVVLVEGTVVPQGWFPAPEDPLNTQSGGG